MSKQDGLIFGLTGLASWAASTAYYVAFGPHLLETAFWFYALNAFLAAVATTALFHGALRLRRVPRRGRALALACFTVPGLLMGAATVLNLTQLFPDMDPVSLGRYGAFMVVGSVMATVTALEPRAKPAASHAR